MSFGEAAFLDFASAMQAGNTTRLRSLIDPAFTLTHITGYVQPGLEWLAEMDRGEFVYYGISCHDLSVTTTGDTGHLIARTQTDARVYGSRNTWPLQLAMDFAQRDGRWIARRAVASLWR